MAKKKKQKRHEEEIPESWLLPYSDLLTLLLALFIVLFASSTVDSEKMKQISSVFNAVFDSNNGVSSPSVILEEIVTDEFLKDQNDLADIKAVVDNFIASNKMDDTFNTQLSDEGLLITIRDSILFDSGKADVKKEYQTVTKELASILATNEHRPIVITGHTDNVPIQNQEFNSNWRLSVERAVNFLSFLTENYNISPDNYSVKGFGESKPIGDNQTTEGKAKNRRVEILIQPLVNRDGTAILQPTVGEEVTESEK